MKKIFASLFALSAALLAFSPPLFSNPPGGFFENTKNMRDQSGFFAGDVYDFVMEGKKEQDKKSVRKFKGDLYALLKEGNALYERKEFEAAEKIYQKAREGAPNALVTNFNMGCVQYKKGEYEAARVSFHGAFLQSDLSTKAQILFNVGNSFFRQGEYLQAMDIYVQALKLDPGNQAAKHNLEMCLVETQKVPRMEERLSADDMLTEETRPGTHTNTVSEPEENLELVEKHLTRMDVVGAVGGTTESLIQFKSQYTEMSREEMGKILAEVEKDDILLLKEVWRSKVTFSNNVTKDW